MSTLRSALPRMLSVSVSRDELNGSDPDHSKKSYSVSNEDWNSSSEEDWQIESETYWDTDDEAEESNAIDDAYKILEGDW
jgi:hypothetical protein